MPNEAFSGNLVPGVLEFSGVRKFVELGVKFEKCL